MAIPNNYIKCLAPGNTIFKNYFHVRFDIALTYS